MASSNPWCSNAGTNPTPTDWATAPFGGDLTAYRTFDITIPSAGTFGWFYGTDRWPEGEFFRYEITALELER